MDAAFQKEWYGDRIRYYTKERKLIASIRKLDANCFVATRGDGRSVTPHDHPDAVMVYKKKDAAEEVIDVYAEWFVKGRPVDSEERFA